MSAPHSALPAFLKQVTDLINADKYEEVGQAFAAFVKEHPTTRYLASEPIPFKVNVRLSTKYGSSATSTFTLRHTTWAEDLKRSLSAEADAFAALAAKYDGEVAEVAKTVKKVA
ncbi:hypothetical protein [Ancylobacter defluvii]|uniref:Uncharacterized protein n=1 Tax=Ancylobacter defluvii TaxID=1282440 RepID=A0A9W6JWD7_9HYPH|nr:hypothetical protein [Ancylobacter defluvii]MBS7587788.1 hypothetical protein [Ancylobacter defluvii]GLK82598.1 hypothetical protein GCM10017653_06670 [Ancylobacter defluvii]